MSKFTRPFYQVPESIYEHGLTSNQLAVAGYLYKMRNTQTDQCFPSEELIASKCKISKRSIKGIIRVLSDLGYVTVSAKGRGYLYTLYVEI
jgi:DNA-binding MarR family transcriptional regulator